MKVPAILASILLLATLSVFGLATLLLLSPPALHGTAITIAGGNALPIDRAVFDLHPGWLAAPHHCCAPAIDIPVEAGTAILAVADGRAVRIDEPGGCGWGYLLADAEHDTFIYCHLSMQLIATGSSVHAGEVIGATGGIVGAPGSGNSTGAHLHFGLRREGVDLCPQPLLQAWFAGVATAPSDVATRIGCTT